ncbi:MAG: histone deacetylase [Pseudomonadota bacterium]|jgi:acetoin utilization deacetylase AcuC-like enzyme
MHVSFHQGYRVDLPPTHPYPMGKYVLLRSLLDERGLSADLDYREPGEVPLEVLSRVHTADYLARLGADALTMAQRRQLGIPFTPSLWRRSRLTVEGTRLAASAALTQGLAANLAGGTHHAFADHGEGYCVVNDVAVAIADLLDANTISRALVVDLDVHQGNGTAAIFAARPAVYTLSLHGQHNYPSVKARSTHDVGLPDGTGDAAYLDALRATLGPALEEHQPELVCYVAGVDVVAGDRFGRLSLTEEGLRSRDRYVIETVRAQGVPLAIVLGGGYAPTTQRTTELHAIVFEEALRRWHQERSAKRSAYPEN